MAKKTKEELHQLEVSDNGGKKLIQQRTLKFINLLEPILV